MDVNIFGLGINSDDVSPFLWLRLPHADEHYRPSGARSGEHTHAGLPVRVEGATVRVPEDEGGYDDDDVRDMFPPDIADLILNRSELTSP